MEQFLVLSPNDENPAAATACRAGQSGIGAIERPEPDAIRRNETMYSAGMRDLRPNRSLIVSQVMPRRSTPARLSEEDDVETYDDWSKLDDKQKLVALHRAVDRLGRRHCTTLQMLSDKVEQLNAEVEKLRLGQPGKADPDREQASLRFRQSASTASSHPRFAQQRPTNFSADDTA